MRRDRLLTCTRNESAASFEHCSSSESKTSKLTEKGDREGHIRARQEANKLTDKRNPLAYLHKERVRSLFRGLLIVRVEDKQTKKQTNREKRSRRSYQGDTRKLRQKGDRESHTAIRAIQEANKLTDKRNPLAYLHQKRVRSLFRALLVVRVEDKQTNKQTNRQKRPLSLPAPGMSPWPLWSTAHRPSRRQANKEAN